MRLSSTVVALALAFCLALPAPSAKADLLDNFLASVLLGTVGAAGAVYGATGLIGNTVYLADGEKAPFFWQVAGYAGGGITIAGGAVILGAELSDIDDLNATNAALGAGLMTLGVAEILVAFFASQAPDPEPALEPHEDSVLRAPRGPSYGLSPLIAPGADGHTTYGLTLSVQGF